jgi:histidinol-phosphate/aromatic aminotransferase/cobyric acid decarboxylase-like protein
MSYDPLAHRVAELEAELRRVRAERDRLARELAALRVMMTVPPTRACRDPHAL